jgi:serine phosphatase RsbU (regulator of sigma subunit)
LTVSCDEVTISAILEPCYAVGGDGYDYAVDDPLARIAILDAVGKGLQAASPRRSRSRRSGRPPSRPRAARPGADGRRRTARAVPRRAVRDRVPGRLDVHTGRLRYLNAGHPAPLLLRAGKSITQITGGHRMPLGLDDATDEFGERTLQPGRPSAAVHRRHHRGSRLAW